MRLDNGMRLKKLLRATRPSHAVTYARSSPFVPFRYFPNLKPGSRAASPGEMLYLRRRSLSFLRDTGAILCDDRIEWSNPALWQTFGDRIDGKATPEATWRGAGHFRTFGARPAVFFWTK